jgi:hypothetical protein
MLEENQKLLLRAAIALDESTSEIGQPLSPEASVGDAADRILQGALAKIRDRADIAQALRKLVEEDL